MSDHRPPFFFPGGDPGNDDGGQVALVARVVTRGTPSTTWYAGTMEEPVERVRMTGQGRIVVPAGMRRALGVEEGDPMTIRLVDGELRIAPIGRSVRKWQEYARTLNPEGASLVDELLVQRRAEVARDLGP